MEKKNTMYPMPLLRLTTIMVHVSVGIFFGALLRARNLRTLVFHVIKHVIIPAAHFGFPCHHTCYRSLIRTQGCDQ